MQTEHAATVNDENKRDVALYQSISNGFGDLPIDIGIHYCRVDVFCCCEINRGLEIFDWS